MTATEVTELDAAAHTIKNVTIYKAGKADIVRTFSVDLEVKATLSCKFLQVPLTFVYIFNRLDRTQSKSPTSLTLWTNNLSESQASVAQPLCLIL